MPVWASLALLVLAAEAEAERDYVAVEETPFVVADSGTPARIDEELETEPVATWPLEHRNRGRLFVDPFEGLELYPEVSVGTSLGLSAIAPASRAAFGSRLDLSFYVLDIHVPLVSHIEGNPTQQRVDAIVKVPFAIPGAERHRFALAWGALISPAGPAISESSRFELHYGVGGLLSFQMKLGYGHEQMFPGEPLRLGALVGLTLGAHLGWIEPLVQFDGIQTTGTRSNRLAVMPGLRFYPLGEPSLQLDLAGLWSAGRGQDTPGRRAGMVFGLSYVFL